MTLALNTITSARGATHRRKRLGRGNASGHGTYSTRGIKGQRARQGGRKGLTQLGVKHFIAHLPKVRGFKTLKVRPEVITIIDLGAFAEGTRVTPELLRQHGLAADRRRPVKLVGAGTPPPKLTVAVHKVTPGARAAIEKAGGSVELIPVPKG